MVLAGDGTLAAATAITIKEVMKPATANSQSKVPKSQAVPKI